MNLAVMNFAVMNLAVMNFAVMNFAVIVSIVAVPIFGLIVLCFLKPFVIRVIARIFAVLASGAGVTGIVAGILFLQVKTTNFAGGKAIWILATGAGLLVGGIIALVLSFVGRRHENDDASGELRITRHQDASSQTRP